MPGDISQKVLMPGAPHPTPREQKEGQKLWKHYTHHLRYTHARGNDKQIENTTVQ